MTKRDHQPTVRPARRADSTDLERLLSQTWTPSVTPSGPYQQRPFFDRYDPSTVLVVKAGSATVGFLVVGPATDMPSNAHVRSVHALGVDVEARRLGVGRSLVAAAAQDATDQGASRLTLHVLQCNTEALALYSRCGFEEDGRLHREFLLPVGASGALVYVDDVLLACTLSAVAEPPLHA
jgi:ribosomal protein S18 acetylase RimI-like enzyme